MCPASGNYPFGWNGRFCENARPDSQEVALGEASLASRTIEKAAISANIGSFGTPAHSERNRLRTIHVAFVELRRPVLNKGAPGRLGWALRRAKLSRSSL